MPTFRLFKSLLPLAATLLLSATPALCIAADITQAVVTKPALEPIATGDITLRADGDERYVQDVMMHTSGRNLTAKLEPQLAKLSEGVGKLAGRFKSDELLQLSIVRLESLQRHWEFYARQLELWRRELQRATAVYSDDAAQLAKRRAVWEATRATSQSGAVAPALQDRIDSVLAQITLAEQAISGPLDAQSRLSRRANVLASGIESGKKGVDAAVRYYDQRLRTIDSPPYLETWGDASISREAANAARVGLEIEGDFLDEYALANRDRVLAGKIVSLALLPLLIWLSRRSRKLVTDDPELQSSARVLLRPVSSWLVLVLVGTMFLQADAPLLLTQTALLLALVPVLRLLPKRLYDVLGPWPYIVTVLYVLKGLGFFLVPSPFLYRTNLLLISAITLIALVWLLISRAHRQRSAKVSSALVTVVRAFGWSAAVAMLVSIVSNLLGNTSLAEALDGAVLDSAYVGLALYAGANVLGAIVKLLLARKTALRFRIVTEHAGSLLESISRLINVAAFVTWVVITLNEFRIYQPVYRWATGVLSHQLVLGRISVTLGGVLLFFLSIYVAFWLAKTIRYVLHDEILPKMELPRGVSNSISTLSYYTLVIVGIFTALAAAGFEMSQLTLVIGALGVGIGLGLQDVVKNFVSGLILMFERPIQPGDIVEISGTSGKVREIGMRATTLSTFDGADVVVPNGSLLSDKLINWTLSDMNRRFDVNLGVAYGSNPRQVMELLMKVTKETPGVASYPEPAIVFNGFGTSSLDFSIRAWTNDFGDWVNIRSEMSMRLYDALAAAGIEIPFPQQDVHVRSIDAAARTALQAALAPGDPKP
ncbi:MAG TPA: mechanosensitive ion channel domain-containing protein [Steroidobacteraceae bacterium]